MISALPETPRRVLHRRTSGNSTSGNDILVVTNLVDAVDIISRITRISAGIPPSHVARSAQSARHLLRETPAENPFKIAIIDVNLTNNLRGDRGIPVIAQICYEQKARIVIAFDVDPDDLDDPRHPGVRALGVGAHDYINTKWIDVNWYVLLKERLAEWWRVANACK